MAIIGNVVDGYLQFDAVAGTSYELSLKDTQGEFHGSVNDANGNLVGTFRDGNAFDGSPMRFTSTVAGILSVWIDGGTIVSFDVAPTSETLVNQALDAIKVYIDAKDASVKAHAESLVNQLMQTSDLTAKLALLNQINDILDGDAATEGFQAWQSSLNRLNALETLTNDNYIGLHQIIDANVLMLRNLVTDTENRLGNVSLSINAEIDLLKGSTSEFNRAFSVMKSRASSIFAV